MIEKENITEELVKSLSLSIQEEIRLWSEEQKDLTSGYDYESQFAIRMHNISNILLQESVGNHCKSSE